MAARRKTRSPRRTAYRLAVAAGVAALAGGMFRSVERGSEAREVSRRLNEIDRQTVEARARLTDAMRRVDSLSSRDRILAASARLGLHPPSDSDISFLRLRADGEADGSAPGGSGGER